MLEIRFRLTEKNEKDKIIMQMLENEYNVNEAIKGILYKLALSVNRGQPVTLAGGVKVVYNPNDKSVIVNQSATNVNENDNLSTEIVTTSVNDGNEVKSTEIEPLNIEVGNDLAKMFENWGYYSFQNNIPFPYNKALIWLPPEISFLSKNFISMAVKLDLFFIGLKENKLNISLPYLS